MKDDAKKLSDALRGESGCAILAGSESGFSFGPSSYNEKTGTIRMQIHGGEAVIRRPFFSEPFYLKLSTEAGAIDTTRLDAGNLHLLTDHEPRSSGVLGIGVQGSFIASPQPSIEFRLDDAPDTDPNSNIIRKLKAGVLRGVSVGADWAHEDVEIVRDFKDGLALMTVRKWELKELSVMPLPASPTAASLSDHHGAPPRKEEGVMKTPEELAAAAKVLEEKTAADLKAATAQGVEAEKLRTSDIREAAKLASLSDDPIVKKLIDDGASLADASKALFSKLHDNRTAEIDGKGAPLQITGDHGQKMRDGALNAIMNRSNPGSVELDDNGKRFRGMSMIEVAEKISGRNPEGSTKSRRASLAMSTPDFPLLLAAGTNKVLGTAYTNAPSTYQIWATRRDLPDFKTQNIVRRSAAPALVIKPEGGVTIYGTLSETAQGWNLLRYSTGVNFTFEMMVNDDLGAFADMAMALGAQTARAENSLVYAHMVGNPTMAEDSVVLFHTASHGNLAPAGAAPGETTIDAMFQRFGAHTDIDGSTKLNIQPRYMLGGTATRLARTKALGDWMPTAVAEARPEYFNGLTNVTDAELTGNAWYTIADSSSVDTMRYGWLEGAPGPQVSDSADFDSDNIKVRVVLNFGFRAVDYRGFDKNPGA